MVADSSPVACRGDEETRQLVTAVGLIPKVGIIGTPEGLREPTFRCRETEYPL